MIVAWIVRIVFILAAPIAALLVSGDALELGWVKTLLAMLLLVGVFAAAAAWSERRRQS